MKYPWVAFYPAEYISKTRGLTMKQHGAYFLLLCEYYMNGPLVANATALLNVCGARTEEDREDVVYILKTFFVFEDGFYHNKRADEEIKKRSGIRKQMQLNGRKGGLAKASNLLEQKPSKALACLQSHNTHNTQEPKEETCSSKPVAIARNEEPTPEDLHPWNYAQKIIQEFAIPKTNYNIQVVTASVEAEMSAGKTGAAAYEFIVAGINDARDDGYAIDAFLFQNSRYRIENRRQVNGNGKKSFAQLRDEHNNEVIARAQAKAEAADRERSNFQPHSPRRGD